MAGLLLFPVKGFSGNHRSGVSNIDTAVITIDIKAGRRASFYYQNRFGETIPPCFLTNKDHEKKFGIKTPTLIIDAYHQIPFLIYPGEHLKLTVDENDLPHLFVDNNQIRNNELSFFTDYYKKLHVFNSSGLFFSSHHFEVYRPGFDFNAHITKSKTDSAKRSKFLKGYQSAHQISAAFSFYTATLFKYLYYMNVAAPLAFKSIDFNELPAGYVAYLDSQLKEFNCDDCLYNEAYRRVSGILRDYVSRKFAHSEKSFSLSYDTISTVFSGQTRRYILWSLLVKDLELSPLNYQAKFAAFMHEPGDIYSQYLNEEAQLHNKFKLKGDNKKEIAGVNGQHYNWTELLAKYKGNVVYLDFWASWCVPCRQNMADSRKLETLYKNEKIAFVYISIDDNPSAWQKAMNDEHLDKNNSYLLINQKTADLKKQFKINSIPRYFVIGKSGAVITDNAPYPSDRVIQPAIKQYLAD